MSESKKVVRKKVITIETLEDGTERTHIAEYSTVQVSNGLSQDIAVGKDKGRVTENDKCRQNQKYD